MKRKQIKGFASLSPERAREIAILGGKASQRSARKHQLTPEQRKRGAENGGASTLLMYGREFFKTIAAKKRRGKKMSHVVEMKATISNLNALWAAAEQLGMKVVTKKTYKKYYEGAPGECDYALAIPENRQAYEIGVKLQADGTYKLLWDPYNGGYGLQNIIGASGTVLVDEYSAQFIYQQAAELGHVIESDYYNEQGERCISVLEQ